MEMQLKVLQHHIEQGEPGRASWCAIAVALRELHPELTERNDILVGPLSATVGDQVWLHDGKAFIDCFDLDLPVSPTVITLHTPAPR